MSDPTAPDLPVLPPEPEGAPAPAPDPTPSPDPKPAAGWKGWVAAGAACGVVVVGGIYVTRDDDPAAVDTTSTPGGQVDSFGGPGRGAFGEITDIDGSTITLTSSIPGEDGEGREITVETDDDTTFTDVVTGDVDDLEVGDQIIVGGEIADGAVTAESITEQGDDELTSGPMRSGDAPVLQGEVPDDGSIRVFPGGQAPPEGMTPPDRVEVLNRIAMGEITAIDGDRITVETPFDEEIVVTVADDTEVKVTEEISVEDLEEGDEIRVTGDREDDVVSADSVRRGDAPMVFGGPATGPSASTRAS